MSGRRYALAMKTQRHMNYLKLMRRPYTRTLEAQQNPGGHCMLCEGQPLLDYEGMENWTPERVEVLGKHHGQEQKVIAYTEGRMLESLEDAARFAFKVVVKTRWFDPLEMD